jgi:hypothetical protein
MDAETALNIFLVLLGCFLIITFYDPDAGLEDIHVHNSDYDD